MCCGAPSGALLPVASKVACTAEEQERVLRVKRFCQPNAVVTVQREFRVIFDCRKGPERSKIERLEKTCNVSGVLMDFLLPAPSLLTKQNRSLQCYLLTSRLAIVMNLFCGQISV